MQRLPHPRVMDIGTAIRRAVTRAFDAAMPANGVAWEQSMGIGRTQVMGAVAELGVADELAHGRATAAELAPRVGADADALHRLLRAAAEGGLVRIDRRGRFRLTRVGRTLRSDIEGSMRPWARYMALGSTVTAWNGLTDSVRTGDSAFRRVHGDSVWNWFAAHPEEEQLFAAAMRSVTEFEGPTLAAASLWPETGTLCDVAGGAGTLLAAVLDGRPGLRGVLVEAPGVLTAAGSCLRRRGLADRVELVEGDLFAGFDVAAEVYTLKNILHDWDDATSAKILATVRAAMAPGTRLLLIEQLQERNRAHPFASITDLQMLTQCEGGRERSAQELRTLLAGAGLTPGRVERAGVSAILEGTSGPAEIFS